MGNGASIESRIDKGLAGWMRPWRAMAGSWVGAWVIDTALE
jgi:hypothetical protein